jgi:hypothetical protein
VLVELSRNGKSTDLQEIYILQIDSSSNPKTSKLCGADLSADPDLTALDFISFEDQKHAPRTLLAPTSDERARTIKSLPTPQGPGMFLSNMVAMMTHVAVLDF